MRIGFVSQNHILSKGWLCFGFRVWCSGLSSHGPAHWLCFSKIRRDGLRMGSPARGIHRSYAILRCHVERASNIIYMIYKSNSLMVNIQSFLQKIKGLLLFLGRDGCVFETFWYVFVLSDIFWDRFGAAAQDRRQRKDLRFQTSDLRQRASDFRLGHRYLGHKGHRGLGESITCQWSSVKEIDFRFQTSDLRH